MIGPVAADPSWQAREATGFDNSAFTIDWATRTATRASPFAALVSLV
jgi:hypothetical protein